MNGLGSPRLACGLLRHEQLFYQHFSPVPRSSHWNSLLEVEHFWNKGGKSLVGDLSILSFGGKVAEPSSFFFFIPWHDILGLGILSGFCSANEHPGLGMTWSSVLAVLSHGMEQGSRRVWNNRGRGGMGNAGNMGCGTTNRALVLCSGSTNKRKGAKRKQPFHHQTNHSIKIPDK